MYHALPNNEILLKTINSGGTHDKDEPQTKVDHNKCIKAQYKK